MNFRYVFCSILAILFGWSCSSAPQKNEHLLQSVLLYNLHFRRPQHLGARPNANWDDEDYFSQSRPNSNWDCEPLQKLFKELKLEAVRSCLRSVNEAKEKRDLSYILKRGTMPILELEDLEKAPLCVKDLLSQIPVPREIFFQSKDEGRLSCYSSRIPLASEEFLKIRSHLHRFKVKINFPLEPIPKDDRETEFLLSTWVLASFFGEDQNRILSKLVPNEICRKCIGDSHLFLESDSLPPSWPK